MLSSMNPSLAMCNSNARSILAHGILHSERKTASTSSNNPRLTVRHSDSHAADICSMGTQEVNSGFVNSLDNAIVLTKLEVISEHFVALHGCRITATRNVIFVAFCLLTAYETLLAVLTAVQACQHLRQTRSPWVTKLYKDGIVFYFYLLVLSCANIVSYRIAPAFGPWLEAPQRVILSVFCSRVLFLIFKGSCSTHGARPRDIETASELPVVTLTEILETEDFEDM
ncbi:hypothetical protein F5050DRAFT_1805719 [Lentinula boryana]|uniref:THH1/TOM1/TOM3 domain-containing protein n=1 Tax=Lentinula boryana TaxID=40481 RepID=A0ABQ8QJV1_9AGAR|nr:hypothetical protein F5050DRAFT_1805719 [Lentinula boryana]